MAYDPFTDGKPVATDTGLQAIDYMRENLMALRDAVTAGAMPGWNYAPSGGTNDEPAQIVYSKGTERVRGSLTWGTTGGEDGNVTKVVWEYSSNSGTLYEAMDDASGNYVENIAYNTDGTIASITWGSTP